MQNQVPTIDELIVARHKLAQIVCDEVITTEHYSLADKVMIALCEIDRKIMFIKIGRKALKRNRSNSGKNKHKQSGNRV